MKVYELINFLMEYEAGANVTIWDSEGRSISERDINGTVFNEKDGVMLFAKLGEKA
jgi:hypothetical protein